MLQNQLTSLPWPHKVAFVTTHVWIRNSSLELAGINRTVRHGRGHSPWSVVVVGHPV